MHIHIINVQVLYIFQPLNEKLLKAFNVRMNRLIVETPLKHIIFYTISFDLNTKLCVIFDENKVHTEHFQKFVRPPSLVAFLPKSLHTYYPNTFFSQMIEYQFYHYDELEKKNFFFHM